eukprot:jgi/Mesvir1/19282/Mv10358-RA.1
MRVDSLYPRLAWPRSANGIICPVWRKQDVMVAPIMTPFQPATISSPETGAAKTPGSKPSTAGEGLQYGTPVATPGGASTRRKRGASDGGAADASSARALIQSLPKDSAAHRLRLMVEGMGSPAQEDAVLDNVTQPVLLLASAKDQVIDSVGETRRLESKMQRARARASRGAARMVGRAKDKAPAAITRVILPNCSHMPLLEAPFSLAATLRKHGFTAPTPMPVPAPVTAPSPTTPPLQAPVVIQASSSIAVAALDSASSAVRTLADTPATPSTVVIAEGSYVEAQSVRADAEPLSGAVASTFSQASLTVIVPAGAAGEMGREGDGADVLPELRARKDSPRARPSRRAGGEGELGRGLGDDQSDYHPSNLDELGRMLEPWRLLTSPKIFGAENLPRDACKNKRPVLFVGNHGLYGFYDSPLIFHELHLQGFTCRAMAHPNIMNGPLGPLFKRYGSVKATPQGMFNALKNGENVLLFPGGARDVHKKKTQKNQIMWAEERNFVRLAARFGAIIVPFATLGADDSYEIALDADDMLSSPLLGPLLGQIIRNTGIPEEELLLPVPGVPLGNMVVPSLLPIPRVERVYLYFGQPVDTSLVPQVLRSKEAVSGTMGHATHTHTRAGPQSPPALFAIPYRWDPAMHAFTVVLCRHALSVHSLRMGATSGWEVAYDGCVVRLSQQPG